ncbi:MAG TPA: winged helix-turn-helix domain-containing protein [Anaerolineae bacterium]|nr:winged helix-turn-helix domain-containing protein [Anaerolineae bacterium]
MKNLINDDEKFVALLDEGKTGKEVAAFFNVSPSAVSQRLKKLKLQAQSDAVLTPLSKEKQAFVIERASGKNNLEAARVAFPNCTTKESLKVMGSRCNADPDVTIALSTLMAQEGIPRRKRIGRLKDMIMSPDMTAVGKGLDMSWKLDGAYAPEEIHIVPYDPVAMRERFAELKALMQEAIEMEKNTIEVKTTNE